MLKRSLIETNPYLQGPEQYREALLSNVASSSAVETGAPVDTIVKTLRKASSKTHQIKKPRASAR